MWERVRQIIIKEFRQTLREPRMRLVLVMPPMIQLVIFGLAVNLDVENARVAWMDLDRTMESRRLLVRFEASSYFDVAAQASSEAEVQRLLDTGEVQAVIRILPGFARDVVRGRETSVQVLIDGSNSNIASIIGNYAVRIIGDYSNEVMSKKLEGRLVAATAGGPVPRRFPSVRAESRVWFNEDLRSRNYFVPGVVVNIIMIVTVILTAMAIVKEKEIGTMEQLMVSPIRSAELILGKLLPFAMIGLVDMVLVTTLALLIFQVPFRGNLLVLFLGACLFILSTLGVGLFLSTVSHTQQQAMMGSFFFLMPASMLNASVGSKRPPSDKEAMSEPSFSVPVREMLMPSVSRYSRPPVNDLVRSHS